MVYSRVGGIEAVEDSPGPVGSIAGRTWRLRWAEKVSVGWI